MCNKINKKKDEGVLEKFLKEKARRKSINYTHLLVKFTACQKGQIHLNTCQGINF